MKTVVFSGCSFTAGVGWSETDKYAAVKDCDCLWTNLVHRNIPRFRGLTQINCANGGASNTDIFESTIKIIGEEANNIHTLFCQWTAGPRYNFNVGFELWDTSESFLTTIRSHDINLNRGDRWSRRYVKNLLEQFITLHHVHWEILKIVKYTNIISDLAKLLRFKVFFINGLCPWDQDYFTRLHNCAPESYTPFTKKEILNIDSRDDQQIHELYHRAHDQYQEAGGVDQSRWINLYDSMLSNRVDYCSDKMHPGTKSNEIYFQIIQNRLANL